MYDGVDVGYDGLVFYFSENQMGLVKPNIEEAYISGLMFFTMTMIQASFIRSHCLSDQPL